MSAGVCCGVMYGGGGSEATGIGVGVSGVDGAVLADPQAFKNRQPSVDHIFDVLLIMLRSYMY